MCDSSEDGLHLGPLVLQRVYSERTHKQTNAQTNERTNKQTMSKADNNNNYNYNQILGEKLTWRRRHIIPRPEI